MSSDGERGKSYFCAGVDHASGADTYTVSDSRQSFFPEHERLLPPVRFCMWDHEGEDIYTREDGEAIEK